MDSICNSIVTRINTYAFTTGQKPQSTTDLKAALLLALLVTCSSTPLTAQSAPEFVMNFWVKDAAGYVDTVEIGYDRTEVNSNHNILFGEVEITEKWDTVYEVRVSQFDDIRSSITNGYGWSKRGIASFDELLTEECGQGYISVSEGMYLAVSGKRFPFTIYWDRAALNDPENLACREQSLIGRTDEIYLVKDPIGTDVAYIMNYMDSLVVPKDPPPFGYHYVLDLLENDQVDSIYYFPLYFSSWVFFVSVHDPTILESIKVFPNPMREELFVNNDVSDKEAILSAYDTNGRPVLSDIILSPGTSTAINVVDLIPGLYYYVVRYDHRYAGATLVKLK